MKTFVIIFLIGISFLANSQSDKESIVVLPVVKNGFETSETKKVTKELMQILRKSNRFNIMNMSVVVKGADSHSRAFCTGVDSEMIQYAKEGSVQYLMTGEVISYFNDGKACEFVFSIHILDVESNSYVASDEIEVKIGTIRNKSNVKIVSQEKQDKKFEEILIIVSKEIQNFVRNEF